MQPMLPNFDFRFSFKVCLSHRSEPISQLPTNIIQKPAITELVDNGANFDDSTEECFDEILYCTGKQ